MSFRISILFTILFLSSSSYAQFYNKDIEAEIDISVVNDLIELTVFATNKTQVNSSLRYVFSVIYPENKQDELEKEETQGRLVLKADEKLEVLNKTLEADLNQKIILLLLIYDIDDKIIGKDRKVIEKGDLIEDDTKVRIVDVNDNIDVKSSEEDGILLKGIVIEDTKTKPGSDFYKEFYSDYLSKNIDGKEIVTIKEVLAIGRNTKIEVYVANTKVLEFFVRPSLEYLREMKNYAILRVRNQLEIINKSQNTVQHY